MKKIILTKPEVTDWVRDVLKHSPVKYLGLPRKDGEPDSKDRSYNQGELDVGVLTDRICTYPQSRLLMYKDGTEQQFIVETEVTTPHVDQHQNPDSMCVALSTLNTFDLKNPANSLKYEFDEDFEEIED